MRSKNNCCNNQVLPINMVFNLVFLLLIVFVTDSWCAVLNTNNNGQVSPSLQQQQSGPVVEQCEPEKLTVYKMVLHTFWSRDIFPKHYPDWRPSAQWSKVFGRSHDKTFTLFRLGQRSSPGVKAFSETARADLLEQQTQGEYGIYDEFNAPPITVGAGRTEAEFFVDGNHSKVSLMSRIIPSPDWFIGIDSFDLCVNGNWLDSITIEVDPIDAGTDNGFTFTAPNWPTEPQGVAYKITSRYPAHPAGSFYYPNLVRLPPIATFQFIKMKEYELNEVFHHSEDERRYELLKTSEHHLTTGNHINVLNGNNNGYVAPNSDLQLAIEEEREEQENHLLLNRHNTLLPSSLPTTSRVQQQLSTLSAMNNNNNNNNNSSNNNYNYSRFFDRYKPGPTKTNYNYYYNVSSSAIPSDDKNAILNSIVDKYRVHNKDNRRKKYRSGKQRSRKLRAPRDCRVSDWSEWSACSKSCGIGEMQRHREILKHARRGGLPCPPLLETKWCGSARACTTSKTYFNW